jgi:radical SAM superfamily enzyme YgiQ (UPF0313 family)
MKGHIMSKIVFISPSSARSVKSGGFESVVMQRLKGRYCSFIAPLSVAIFATLTPPEHSFIFVDEEIDTVDFDGLNPDLVAITTMSVQAMRAYQIAGEFKKRGATIVIGGIHASVMTEEVVDHCDAAVVGEGENIWPILLEDFKNGTLKKVYDAKDYPPVTEFVAPKYSIYKNDNYLTFPIQATKGCPYNCDFCSIRYSSGHKYRMKPVEDVIKDIEEAEKYNDFSKGGVERKSYFFVDDNLYVNRAYTQKLFAAMAEKDISWDGQGTINTASDEETVELMAKSGCRSFNFGLESISELALKEINKPKINVDADYATAIKTLMDKGIIPGAFFISGFDEDDVTAFEKTMDFIRETNLLQTVLSMLTPYPGTELYRRMRESKRIFNDSWGSYNSWQCVYTPKQMTADELQAGFHWLTLQMSSVQYSKQAVKKLWEHPVWKRKPKLTIFERLLLIAIASVKLWGKWYGEFRRFLLWAAFYPQSRDFRFLIWFVLRNELAGYSYFTAHYNPAEKRREQEKKKQKKKES